MAKLYAKSPSGEDALLSISITGFTQSLQQNGWCKLPNGLLVQWRGPISSNTTYGLVINYTEIYAAYISILNSSETNISLGIYISLIADTKQFTTFVMHEGRITNRSCNALFITKN